MQNICYIHFQFWQMMFYVYSLISLYTLSLSVFLFSLLLWLSFTHTFAHSMSYFLCLRTPYLYHLPLSLSQLPLSLFLFHVPTTPFSSQLTCSLSSFLFLTSFTFLSLSISPYFFSLLSLSEKHKLRIKKIKKKKRSIKLQQRKLKEMTLDR